MIKMSLSEKFLEGSMFINGEYVLADSTLDNIHPGNGKVFGKVAIGNYKDINQAVEAAKKAQTKWAAYSLRERGKILTKIGSLLEERTEELAKDETMDAGKPIKHTRARDLPYTIKRFEFYGSYDESLKFLEPENPVEDTFNGYIRHEPIGVGTAIVPPNYPLIQSWHLTKFQQP